jgi:ketosteroid isomerase-like protein
VIVIAESKVQRTSSARWYGPLNDPRRPVSGSVGAVSTQHPNADLIERFYAALGSRDGDAMAACYASEGTFEDPAFGKLNADEAGAMWRMLTSRAGDLTVDVSEITADDGTGSARWIAHYTFTQTGRPVVNDIRASFRFANGLIVQHHDHFDWWRWARQALGPAGLLLGWNPLFHNAARNKARGTLAEFRARETATSTASPGTDGAPTSS